MDSNSRSLSPDSSDKEPSFRASSSHKAKRRYRRPSVSPSPSSSSSDGSPKTGRSPSQASPREEPTKVSDVREKKLDMESGRSRHEKGGDSHRHSDRNSSRSSQAYRRDHDYSRHNKRDDEERSYHRSSTYGRESRSATHFDRTRHESEHDRSGEYCPNTDKYMKKHAGEERRVMDKDREERKNHRDRDSTLDRNAAGKRYTDSYMDDPENGERDRHKKAEGGRDETTSYRKSLGDHKSDNISSVEEGGRHGQHSNTSKGSDASRRKETHKSNDKDLRGQKVDTIGKREYDNRDSDRHKERFYRETVGKDRSTSSNRKSSGDEKYLENESSLKKFKSFTTDDDKNDAKDGQFFSKPTVPADEKPPKFKLPQEAVTQNVQPSFGAITSHDIDAAKVAAMKAAELVNRNLTGGVYMSTDQKKKLLWGSKKSTPVEESGRWNVSLFPDQERQEKFKKLMGVKGDLKPEHKPDQAEKQEQLQLDLEKQYTAGLRRRDGRTVGLGL